MTVPVHQRRELLHCVAVARVQLKHRLRFAQRLADLEIELRRDVLELREQARVAALLGPQQLGAEHAQRGAPAALLAHQRGAEEALPALEQLPRVAIRELDVLRRKRELAGVVDRCEQLEQQRVDLLARLAHERPRRPDRDTRHMSSRAYGPAEGLMLGYTTGGSTRSGAPL